MYMPASAMIRIVPTFRCTVGSAVAGPVAPPPVPAVGSRVLGAAGPPLQAPNSSASSTVHSRGEHMSFTIVSPAVGTRAASLAQPHLPQQRDHVILHLVEPAERVEEAHQDTLDPNVMQLAHLLRGGFVAAIDVPRREPHGPAHEHLAANPAPLVRASQMGTVPLGEGGGRIERATEQEVVHGLLVHLGFNPIDDLLSALVGLGHDHV